MAERKVARYLHDLKTKRLYYTKLLKDHKSKIKELNQEIKDTIPRLNGKFEGAQ